MSEKQTLRPNIRIGDGHIYVHKDVIRMLGDPDYITLMENEKHRTLAIVPCDESHTVSFKVPKGLLSRAKAGFKIHSKDFVANLRERYCLDQNASRLLEGEYVARIHAVVFRFDRYKRHGFVVYDNGS